jgi:TolB-like protein
MREDEDATFTALQACRRVINNLISKHEGRVFGEAGDSVLAEFGSAVEAVRCAVEIQEEVQTQNADRPDDRKLHFRIGINIGDVIVDADNLYGDGVNVAARLESLADTGGICISGNVHEQVRHKSAHQFQDMGPQNVKNIDGKVAAYRLLLHGGLAPQKLVKSRKPGKRTFVLAAGAAVVLIAIVGGIFAWRNFPVTPQPSAAAPRAAAAPEGPSLVVLPFVHPANDAAQEPFADGITEDLITDLSKIAGLFVIARNSAFSYKGREVNAAQIAEELKVRYILRGSVRRAGDKVRINAQLTDSTNGHQLWSERYDGSLSDIFALQDNVTANIVSGLSGQIKGIKTAPVPQNAVMDRLAKQPGIIEARRAIAFDPNDPSGYLFLAEQLVFLGEPEAAIPVIHRAVRLDPINPNRYAFALALAQLGTNNISDAVKTLKDGLEREPENVHLWFLLAAAQGILDDPAFTGKQFASWGFKRQSDVDRIAGGLRQAGVSQ